MKAVFLERLFLTVLAAGATGGVAGCGPSCPPSEIDTTLSAMEQAIVAGAPQNFVDAGVPDGDVPPDGGTPAWFKADGGLNASPPGACDVCGKGAAGCEILSTSGDDAKVKCIHSCGGRRPAGLVPDVLGGTFAELARLEAASVFAFQRLRAELARHGAPRALLRACSRAARDEVRHARITRALARRRGERLAQPRIGPAHPRSLEAMAVENAVEGCVRETWGAFVATRMARTHADLGVRAAMKRIARDETRHAALAWSVAAWLQPRLGPAARARVRDARRQAAYELWHVERDTDVPRIGGALWA